MEIAKITIIALIATMFTASSFAQEVIRGTVIDKDTKKPIEFVDVYDSTDLVITNSEGKFIFVTSADSIFFSLVGYNKLKLSTKSLKKVDLIPLESQPYKLSEVVVESNNANLYNEAVKSVGDNYPTKKYREEFFLRGVIKKNDTIIKIQDLNGIIERQNLMSSLNKLAPKSKKNYTVYLNNMRKAGYREKSVYYKMYSFKDILNELVSNFIYPKYFGFEESIGKDSTVTRLDFSPKSLKETEARGYYLINTDDKAFVQTYYIDSSEGEFREEADLKFRTIYYEVLVTYAKNTETSKYSISSGKINATVEVFNNDGIRDFYDATYIFKAEPYYNKATLRGKIPISKEVFKLKKDYDPTYWENHNILQLTDEMVEFLERLDSLDSKEFKVTSNIK